MYSTPEAARIRALEHHAERVRERGERKAQSAMVLGWIMGIATGFIAAAIIL